MVKKKLTIIKPLETTNTSVLSTKTKEKKTDDIDLEELNLDEMGPEDIETDDESDIEESINYIFNKDEIIDTNEIEQEDIIEVIIKKKIHQPLN